MTWSPTSLLLALAAVSSSLRLHRVLASSEAAEACAASGAYCGNDQSGPNCCTPGNYCQPWNPTYYQCRPTPARCGTPEVGIDYNGADIADLTGMKLSDDCCNRCASTAGCAAYTFVNNGWDGQPHCYLKSGTGTRKKAVGVVSAVVSSSSTPRATNTTGGHIQAQIRSGAVKSRAVNLGGWLVTEHWITWESALWNGISRDEDHKGEYHTMQILDKEKGTVAFEQHRKTWITEADIKEIADTGVLNTVRVPVGHWIIRDATTAPGTEGDMFARGGLKYLDALINDWAVKYNIAVMISLHAHQGSQNGIEHSAPVTLNTVGWSTSQVNVDNSLKFATFLAARYKNSPAFLGLNLMNEPVPPVDGNVLRNYYIDAYKQIRATGNDCILLVTPFLNDQDPDHLKGMIGAPEYTNVWNEIHAYFIWGYEGKTEEQVLAVIDQYDQSHLKAAPTNNRLFLGEWCMGGPPDSRGIFQNIDNFRELGRKQLAYFNADTTGGWAFWTWRNSDETVKRTGWSMRYLIRNGYLNLNA
ncbi:Glucan 1 [Phytophthora cinnamomi]|uniref:Glucan 1 n=1 Tax=Phytophthora cinnamomi TaxID=4785 RepID=UPI00355A243C|nr:Glucan 1 [Phytophthora cinnamomi]